VKIGIFEGEKIMKVVFVRRGKNTNRQGTNRRCIMYAGYLRLILV
jgi:hypothetical protein